MSEKTIHRPSSFLRRKELVGITYHLIATKGLEGLRTRDVAEAADTDTGTLHYHFPSKELLIQAVVEGLSEDFRANREERVRTPSDAFDELRNEILDVVARVRESPQQLVVMLEFVGRASRDKAVAEILARTRADWKEALVGIFSRGIEQGMFGSDVDPVTAADLLQGQLIGLALVGLTTPTQANVLAATLLTQLQKWLVVPQT
jgi:AcrR family transcriptional regulator